MFARTVAVQLKPNSAAEFTQTIEQDLLPLLRQQPGFQDEMAFVAPGGTDTVSALANGVDGTLQGHTYAVSNSTVRNLVARNAVERQRSVGCRGAATSARSRRHWCPVLESTRCVVEIFDIQCSGHPILHAEYCVQGAGGQHRRSTTWKAWSYS